MAYLVVVLRSITRLSSLVFINTFTCCFFYSSLPCGSSFKVYYSPYLSSSYSVSSSKSLRLASSSWKGKFEALRETMKIVFNSNSTFWVQLFISCLGITTVAVMSTILSEGIFSINFIICLEITSFWEATTWTVENCSLSTKKANFPLTLEECNLARTKISWFA